MASFKHSIFKEMPIWQSHVIYMQDITVVIGTILSQSITLTQ